MSRYLLSLLCCTLLFSGCALFRPPQQPLYEDQQTATVTWDDAPAQEIKKAEPLPKPVAEATPVVVAEPEPAADPESEAEVTAFAFPENETLHVRFANTPNNPFQDSDEVKINLKSLQGEFCYPLPGGKMISPYGPRGRSMHTGMDIKTFANDTIRAAFPGTVRMSKLYSGYGNVIVLCHENGLETVYAHQSKNLVEPNQAVLAGDPIGLTGRTGRATTEHLHFEVRVAGEHLNPALILDPETHALKSDMLYVYHRDGKVRGSNTPPPALRPEPAETVAETTPAASTAHTVRTASTTPTVGTASTANTTPATASANTTTEYHVVKSGDTLGALAAKYSTTVSKICQLNDITPTTILQLNKRLRVK